MPRHIAHNVVGKRRFFCARTSTEPLSGVEPEVRGSPLDKENAEHFHGRKKMWRNKTVQRAKPEHGFVEPSRR